MYAIYGNMDPINIPPMLAYIPYMDPYGIILLPFQNAARHPPPASPPPRPPGEHGDDTGDVGETGAASPAASPESEAWRGETRKVTCQGPWIWDGNHWKTMWLTDFLLCTLW